MKSISRETLSEIGNKVLLVLEWPFYPMVFLFLKTRLQTYEGRKNLYLKTDGYIPLRRLNMYVLDKFFLKITNNYANPSYEGLVGYILDLKYSVANNHFNKRIFKNNYSYTINNIRKMFEQYGLLSITIIDFGCGAGRLTRLIANTFSKVEVIGLDIRHEIMEYNNILYKNITWGHISSLGVHLDTYGVEDTLLVCNGVINFMTLHELGNLLSRKINHIVWFYFTLTDPGHDEGKNTKILSLENNDVHYNLPVFLKEYGYSFTYGLIPNTTGPGFFLHGISKKLI
jgi:hypothetical protein